MNSASTTEKVSYLVAGAGVSGRGLSALLEALGESYLLVDDNHEQSLSTEQAIKLIDAPNAPHTIVTSPGWRPDTPLFEAAHKAGVDVVGDVELAFRLDQEGKFGDPRTWLAVTGTNGKTTTTAMLADIMSAHCEPQGKVATAVGNIGVAVPDALLAPERVDVLIVELSSFQLHWSSSLNVEAGVLLNLAEDHLDWHGGMAAYAEAKTKILQARHAIIGTDDEAVLQAVESAGLSQDSMIGFTLGEPAVGQVGIIDGRIVDNLTGDKVDICSATGIEPAGPAGQYDALAATAVARTQAVEPKTIESALENFSVAGHRGATVHKGAKSWVDNSKATNPHAVDAALAGYTEDVIWIAGGQLKGAAVDDLIREHASKLSAVGLLGVDRHLIAESVNKWAPEVPLIITDSTDPHEAMQELTDFAVSAKGNVVVLAPAAASLDMYSGMAQRGDIFASCARISDTSTPKQG